LVIYQLNFYGDIMIFELWYDKLENSYCLVDSKSESYSFLAVGEKVKEFPAATLEEAKLLRNEYLGWLN
jgi:hypothetical protein